MFYPSSRINGNSSAAPAQSLPIENFLDWIETPFDKNSSGKTQLQHDFSQEQATRINQTIINTEKNADGEYRCIVKFDNRHFSLTQTHHKSNKLLVCPLRSDEVSTISGMDFSELKEQVLTQYLAKHRYLNHDPVDLTEFKLTSDIDLSDLDFSFTRINRKNLNVILKYDCNVHGATLVEAPHLLFPEEGITQALALELIQIGVRAETVFSAYLNAERKRGNESIDISSFDLSAINLKKIDLAGVDFAPLVSYSGKFMLHDHHFSLVTRCGRPCVTPAGKSDLPAAHELAQELQAILQATREDKITPMNHLALPAPLQKLTPAHWTQLGDSVFNELITKGNVDLVPFISNKFYLNIYIKASSHINYVFSEPAEARQKKWEALVTKNQQNPNWKPQSIQHGQIHLGDGAANINETTVFLQYYRAPTQSRIQFVVSSQAGLTLYMDIAKVMDRLINERYAGDPTNNPVKSFKVFSEDFQIGRSDSAVFYLATPLNDPEVSELVDYLHQEIGARIAPVDIIGATAMNESHIQGITIPDSDSQYAITEQRTSSHGGLIKTILAISYQQAVDDITESGFTLDRLNVDELNRYAQFYAKEIWNELGL